MHRLKLVTGGWLSDFPVLSSGIPGKLPLYFIRNDGQVNEKVKFYDKLVGHATYLGAVKRKGTETDKPSLKRQ
jgi:hypothetical protein